MNDYERIAAIIRYGEAHQNGQTDLETLAAQAGLSVLHLHRLLADWGAITPKDFLRCLAAAHSKCLLKAGESVLDAALGGGAPDPGRLHGLCVGLEADAPGQVEPAGKGWILTAGFAETRFGLSLLAESPRGICHLSFVDGNAAAAEWRGLQAGWPEADIRRDDAAAVRLAGKVFHDSGQVRTGPPIKAWVRGTAFQVRVWRALLRIPMGCATSYGRLAEAVGQPAAARAVGSAVGRNPVAYLIPCHRVIRETGAMGGYRWGLVRKKAMIAWETCKGV